MQSVGRWISQTGNINNLRRTDWLTFSPCVTILFKRKKGRRNVCLLGFHSITSQSVEGWNVSPLTRSPVAFRSAVSLLYCWVDGWDELPYKGGWERGRRGGGYGGGQARGCVHVCVCVGLSGECCCLLTWSSIRQGPSIQTPFPPLPTFPTQGPSAWLCQAWNLHINFSSVAP